MHKNLVEAADTQWLSNGEACYIVRDIIAIRETPLDSSTYNKWVRKLTTDGKSKKKYIYNIYQFC